MVTQETSLAPDLSVLENIFLPELGSPGRLRCGALRSGPAIPRQPRAGGRAAAGRRGAAALLGAAAIGRDRQGAGAAGRAADLRRTDRLAEPRRGRAAVRRHGHLARRGPRPGVRVAPARGGVRHHRPGHGDARGPHGRGVAALPSRSTSPTSSGIWSARTSAAYGAPPAARPADDPVVLEVRAPARAAAGARRLVHAPCGRDPRAGRAGRRRAVGDAGGHLRPPAARGRDIRLVGRAVRAAAPGRRHARRLRLVPEDRRSQSIVPDFSVRENLLLGHLSAHRGFALGYGAREQQIAALLDRLGLPAHRLLDANMLNFSGGMQQKIIIARWLLLAPKVLILDEPTKGVDIGTRTSDLRHAARRRRAGRRDPAGLVRLRGAAGLSDRVVVISDGASIADMPSTCARRGEAHPVRGAAQFDGAQRPAAARAGARTRRRRVLGAARRRARCSASTASSATRRPIPGFRAGDAPEIEAARDRRPRCTPRAEAFVTEPAGGRATPADPVAQPSRSRPRLDRALARPGDALRDARPIGSAPREIQPQSDRPLFDAPHRRSRCPPPVVAARNPHAGAGAGDRGRALGCPRRISCRPATCSTCSTSRWWSASVAIGMTFVILTGGIDLSVGSVLGVTADPVRPGAAAFRHRGGASRWPCWRAPAMGLFSGLLIARFGLAAFVVTLGVMAIGRSLAYIFSGADRRSPTSRRH